MELKQLLIELPEKDHRFIKAESARLGMSMKVYVIKALALYAIKTQTLEPQTPLLPERD